MSEEDVSLGGYIRVHDRPPAFDGPDGHPYTVSLEAERTGDLRDPVAGYLLFPRWAQSGVGIVGHVETPTLCTGASTEEVHLALKELPLATVQSHLHEAIARQLERLADAGDGREEADE